MACDCDRLRAENAKLNEEIQRYQVDDGYERGYAHGEGAAQKDLKRLITQKKMVIDALCQAAVQRHLKIEPLGSLDNDKFRAAFSSRMTWIGELVGLRTALCYLHGWDPEEHTLQGGNADELILDWWRRDPEYCNSAPDPTDRPQETDPTQ